MGKRKRVPEVLWRMFGNRARTLSDAIISLIPQHCDCNGRGKCLRCVFGIGDEAAIAHLIRPDDFEEYRQLMMKCFVVIPTDAPPLPPLLSFSLRWSQAQIVERTIETFFSKQEANANMICSGYEKFKMSSSIAKLLTCSIWDLAWRRVGDNLMDYLLMHTLIFMPIKHKGHQQVTGPPVNPKFLRFPTARPDAKPSIHSRHQRKRTRADGNDLAYGAPPNKAPFKIGQSNYFDCIGSMIGNYVGTQYFEMSSLLHSSGTDKLSSNPGSSKMVVCKEHSVELEVNRRKRARLPSWQRRKRCKRPTLQDTNTEESLTKFVNEKGDLCNICQYNMPLLCPCCSAFQSLSPVPKDVLIKRTSMLYNMECSSSLFLKCHIIYSLNPGLAGARDLLRRIFCLSSTEKLSKPASCFDNLEFCSHGSSCLYHSVIKLLKVFLHRAERCQHLRLLKKHCSVQPFSLLSGKGTSSILQRSKMEGELASSKQDADLESNQPLKRLLYDESRNFTRTSEFTQQQFGLPKPYCQNDDVVSFVWAVCRNIIPSELLGGPSFQRILRKNIYRFVKLRRFEKFPLKQCMHRLDISKFPLLSNKHSFSRFNAFAVKHGTEAEQIRQLQPHHLPNICHRDIKQTFLERWIFWFFAHIVVPVVRANFYVTESEHGKQNLYYYRKSVWRKLSDRVTVQLEGHIYRSLCSSSVRSLLSKRSFGFSKVRLCPKETGARPIANLRTASRLGIRQSHSHAWIPQRKKKGRQQKKIGKVSYLKAVNTVLRDLHVIFKDIRMKEPGKWGSSVSSYNDVYRKLCPFLMDIKKEQALMPCMYIVVSDVQKAFDTVSQDKLLSIVNEMQMEDKYTLQKSCEIFCRKKFVWVSENLKLVTQSTDTRLAESIPLVPRRSGHTILVSQDHSKTVKTDELKFILEEHIKGNVLKLGKRFFRQIVGIPQGSVLSSLLCSLYYGHLEQHAIFPLLAKGANGMLDQAANSHTALAARQHANSLSPKYLLLRFVDDFLFLSTSKKQATSFFSRLHRGFREYNCYMNPGKFGTNFETGMPGLDSKRMLVGSDGASFLCWSGLLINSCSLEVQVDYSRYLHDHLSSTLTVSWEGRPDRQLKAKLCAYMRPKCHPIFFDATINSPATIRLNVYQAFLLCAMKFHCYVRELSSVHKLRPKSCLTSIEGSIRYMYNLMKRRMYAISRESDHQPVLQVAKEEVRWLGLTAYVRVLKRKQSRCKCLLHLLRAALLPLSRVESSSELKYAVDDSHSSILWKIKY